MTDNPNSYTGQTFNAPVYINGDLTTNPDITIARQPFLLERYDFSVLRRTESIWFNIGFTFLGATAGLLINMLAKLIGSKIDDSIHFDSWEVFAFILSLILTAICFLINKYVSNEKRRLVERINEHFNNY